MAEKILNTRIQLKYDTYANWTAANPVLKVGEVAVATVEDSTSGTGFQNLPNVVLKVGDGSSHYNALKFVSGLAADVYAWAKAATKPSYTAAEIENLTSFVETILSNHDEIQDTDTHYTVAAVEGSKYQFQLKSYAKDQTVDQATVVATVDFSEIGTRLKDLETKVGSESVGTQITNAINALDQSDSAVEKQFVTAVSEKDGLIYVSRRALVADDIPELAQSKVTGLEDALKDLDDSKQDNLTFNGTYNASTNKVATESTVTKAIEALDNAGQTAGTGEVISAVSEANGVISVAKKTLTEADIPALSQSKITGLETALNGKQDTLTFTSTPNATDNKVVTQKYVDDEIKDIVADLNGAMHFVGKVDTIPTDNTGYEKGDVILVGYDEYVYDGNTWITLGNESIYALKTDVATDLGNLKTDLEGQISNLDDAKQDNLSFEGTYDANTNKVATASYVNSQITSNIQALEKADTAKSGQFVTAVSETNGIISVTRAALAASDIPTLAISKIDGLQTALDGKQATVSFDGAYNADSNKAATVDTVTNAIGGLDKEDSAVTHQFVTAVSEKDGIITVSRVQPTYEDIDGLATIAHTGNVNDLVQTVGDVLVFNCGTATTVI